VKQIVENLVAASVVAC